MFVLEYLRKDLVTSVTVAVLVCLVMVIVWMLVEHDIQQRRLALQHPDAVVQLKRHYHEIQADNARRFASVLALMKSGDYQAAFEKLKEINTDHGDSAYGYLLLARIEYKLGNLSDTIHAYRQVVDKDPDYVDKNTPLFIGTEIMDVITEARGKLSRERKLKPGDMKIKTAIDDIYYLQRRIAGGCE